MEGFGALVERWLADTDTSQAQLSRRSTVPQNVISRWLGPNPTQPSPRNLAKLAPVLEVPYEDLMRLCGYLPDLPDADKPQDDKSRAEQYLARRQQTIREQRDRWVDVLGPMMGADAAEDYFWGALKLHMDEMLALFGLSEGAVNAAAKSAVNGAVSAPAAPARHRRRRRGGPLTSVLPTVGRWPGHERRIADRRNARLAELKDARPAGVDRR